MTTWKSGLILSEETSFACRADSGMESAAGLQLSIPGSALAELEESWRQWLAEAERQYLEDRNDETHRIYSEILRIFTALVVRGQVPQ